MTAIPRMHGLGGSGSSLAPAQIASCFLSAVVLLSAGCSSMEEPYLETQLPIGESSRELVSLAFSPDGRTLACSRSGDAHIRVWEVLTGQERITLDRTPDNIPFPGGRLSFAPDGRTLAFSHSGIRLYHLPTGRSRDVLVQPGNTVWGIGFSPDGRTLAWIRGDKIVRLWDTTTGRQRAEIRRPRGLSQEDRKLFQIERIAFSSDSRFLATLVHSFQNSREQWRDIVRLWDIAAGREIVSWDVHVKELLLAKSIAFYPDNQTMLVGFFSKAADRLDIATGERHVLLSHVFRPDAKMALSPDGRLLAVVTEEGMLTLFDAASGKRRALLHEGGKSNDTILPVLAFSPDGRTLAMGHQDGTVRLWDVPSERPTRRARVPGTAPFFPGGFDRHSPSRSLSETELRRHWDALAGADSAHAYEALWALADAPEQAVPFLASHLRAAAAPKPGQLDRLIADLDSDEFAEREKAQRELERLGERAEPALRKASASSPSAEARRRIVPLLERLRGPVSDSSTLQGVRAVEVLEMIGNTEAIAVLRRLAEGASESRLTQEARASLTRLTS